MKDIINASAMDAALSDGIHAREQILELTRHQDRAVQRQAKTILKNMDLLICRLVPLGIHAKKRWRHMDSKFS